MSIDCVAEWERKKKEQAEKYLAHDLRVNYTGRHFINIFALGLMDWNGSPEGGFCLWDVERFCINFSRFSRDFQRITDLKRSKNEK